MPVPSYQYPTVGMATEHVGKGALLVYYTAAFSIHCFIAAVGCQDALQGDFMGCYWKPEFHFPLYLLISHLYSVL